MQISIKDSELQVFAATLYAEARWEPVEGQIWVAWVIKNKSRLNRRKHWGGNSIKAVCLTPFEFECWNCGTIRINDMSAYRQAEDIARRVMGSSHDPTGGCDYYNNPMKEGYPNWTRTVTLVTSIGEHNFYRS